MFEYTANRARFLYKFVHSPQYIGSITPSSIFLAEKMMKEIQWNQVDAIVELGAGTGIFTKYIKKQIKPSTKVIVFEKDDDMRHKLEQDYPEFYFYSDALQLERVLQDLAITNVDAIVSGLPFANFTDGEQRKLVDSIYSSLNNNGTFVAFQYSLQMKRIFKQSFHDVKIDFELLNFPPAFVYNCQK